MRTRGLHRLSVADLSAKTPGLYADGSRLYLLIRRNKRGNGLDRRWVLRYQLPGRQQRDMGLGSAETFGLNAKGLHAVRERAAELRHQLAAGIDPIEHRREQRAKAAAQSPTPTFDMLADQYIREHRAGWRSPAHAQRARMLGETCSSLR